MSAEYSSKFQARMNELFRKAQYEDPKLTKGQYASKIGTTINFLRGWLRGSGSNEVRALERDERSLNRKMENLLNIVEDGALSDVIRGRIMFKAFISQIRVFPKTVEIDFFLDINGRKYIMKQKKRPV